MLRPSMEEVHLPPKINFPFNILSLLLILTLLAASLPTSDVFASQTLTLRSQADSFISSVQPTTNFGKLTTLRTDASPLQKIYIRFTVNGLAGRKIKSARLLLHSQTTSTKGLILKPVANNTWGETSLTYKNAPAIGSIAITSAPNVTAGKWAAFDVTKVINREGLFSFALTTPGTLAINLDSRTSTVYFPRLVLIVDPPDPVLVGVGDIAGCNSSGDEATAALVAATPGTVFTTGDNAYPNGSTSDFANCYNPSWGALKARTRPAPGNHDYNTTAAAAYFNYFGTSAGEAGKGYYSYQLGTWHIVVLNTQISYSAGSPQEKWLRQDLAAHPTACTLAYFHRPLFSSSIHGNNPDVKPIWQALYDYHADVVVNGHDHFYERFAPQTPNGVASADGLREFVAGMGGISHYPISTLQPNSQAHNIDTYGVLKFTLHANSYDWKFIPVAGKTYTDSGITLCRP